MEARYLALLILVPFVAVFAYATWYEYRRFKTEGRNTYGLSYDPETNTTHVGAIPEDEESFDLEDYDPDLLDTEAKEKKQTEANQDAPPDTEITRDADRPDTDPEAADKPDDKLQDTRT